MRILIIEDNEALATALSHRLKDNGHAVSMTHDGETGLAFLTQEDFDLAILDINLPCRDGLDLLRQARRDNITTPVLILTARDTTQERIIGLDTGADDYLVKPFEMDELDARVRALLRRQRNSGQRDRIGKLVFDRRGHSVSFEGIDLGLPRREISIFECLFDRSGRFVSKASLLDYVYGIGADVNDSVIEVYVSRLRKRLTVYGVEIRVARGLGYLMKVAE